MENTPECEEHPYNDPQSIPENTKLLIMGTAPPKRFSKTRSPDWTLDPNDVFDFYYGSEKNQFWTIFSQIFENAKDIIETRNLAGIQDFLKCRKIWFQDICQRYHRSSSGSALDRDLIVDKRIKLRSIFERCTRLEMLVLTGLRTEKELREQLEDEKLLCRYEFGQGLSNSPLPRCRMLSLSLPGFRQITFVTLHSPSRRATSKTKADHYRYALAPYRVSSD